MASRIAMVLNRQTFEYDIHALIRSFIPMAEIKISCGEEMPEGDFDAGFVVTYEETAVGVVYIPAQGEKQSLSGPITGWNDRIRTKNEVKNVVYRLLCQRQVAYGCVDLLVARFVETFGIEQLANHGVSIPVNHQGREHGLLHIKRLWLKMPVGVVYGLLFVWPAATVVIVLYCHEKRDDVTASRWLLVGV